MAVDFNGNTCDPIFLYLEKKDLEEIRLAQGRMQAQAQREAFDSLIASIGSNRNCDKATALDIARGM
jgi:hypothetical protein